MPFLNVTGNMVKPPFEVFLWGGTLVLTTKLRKILNVGN
jgi:hypothetical protein